MKISKEINSHVKGMTVGIHSSVIVHFFVIVILFHASIVNIRLNVFLTIKGKLLLKTFVEEPTAIVG